MLETIKESANYISNKFPFQAQTGIILGTGLGGLVKEIEVLKEISYSEIPHFPVSTVESHAGKLIFGILNGVKVVAMQGRFHYYEGYSFPEIVFPVRVMKMLGVNRLLISNAAGGINPALKKGDLMLINDHINLFNGNPLIGKNIEELGPRFPDMSEVYNKALLSKAELFCSKEGISFGKGVYAGMSGPMLETPAEYKYLGIIGADAIGMSTIPEVIAAKHMGMVIFACSIITDICYGEIKPVNIAEIIATAGKAEPSLTALFKEIVKN